MLEGMCSFILEKIERGGRKTREKRGLNEVFIESGKTKKSRISKTVNTVLSPYRFVIFGKMK